jgi:hypothetical protein
MRLFLIENKGYEVGRGEKERRREGGRKNKPISPWKRINLKGIKEKERKRKKRKRKRKI